MVNKKRVSSILILALLITSLFSGFAFAADADMVLADDVEITAVAHVQKEGDIKKVGKGEVEVGTTGRSLRMEALKLDFKGLPDDMKVLYKGHIQKDGDTDWIDSSKAIVGTTGQSKRLERVAIKLVDKDGKQYPGYSIEYQVHMQSYDWGKDKDNNKRNGKDAWAKDGEWAGTEGEAKRVEAVRIRIKKDDVLKIKSLAPVDRKTLKVSFSKPVEDTNKVTFSAKRDNIPINFSKVTWNDAKTEANLEVSYKLFTGKYVVTAKIGEETLTSPEVVVEESKVATIVFTSDKAIMSTDGKTIYPSVKIENQYGEDLAKEVSSLGITVVSSRGKAEFNNGKLEISLEGDDKFKVNDKVVVTIVHPSTGISTTATLTCAAAPDIAAIELGDLTTKKDEKNLVKGTDLNGEYWLPLNVIDQYGNKITDESILASDFTIVTSNDSIKGAVGKGKDGKLAIVLTGKPNAAGFVTLNVVSKSGKNAIKVLEIKDIAKLDVMTLIQPDTVVKAGAEFKLPFKAYDQYGNELVKAEGNLAYTPADYANELRLGTDAKTVISVTNGKIKAETDYADGNKLVLKVRPETAGQIMMINVFTPTGKYSQLTLNVQDASVAKTITGVKEIYTAMQVGTNQKFNVLENVTYADQYGDEVTPAENNVEFKPVAKDPQHVTYANNSEFNAVKAGKEAFEVILKDDNGKVIDKRTVTIEAVDLKDITTFEVNDIGTLYTGNVDIGNGNKSADYDRTFEVVGKKADGTEVLIKPDRIKAATATYPLKLDLEGMPAKVKLTNKDNQHDTGGAERKGTVTLTIEGANGPVVVTKEVKYSNARPTSESLVAKYNKKDVSNAVVHIPASAFEANKKAPVTFEAEDQYGVKFKHLNYVITNKKGENLDIAFNADGTLAKATVTAGDSFTVTAMTNDGRSVYVQIKVTAN